MATRLPHTLGQGIQTFRNGACFQQWECVAVVAFALALAAPTRRPRFIYMGETHPHTRTHTHRMTPYSLAYKTNYNLFIFCGVWQQHKHIKYVQQYGEERSNKERQKQQQTHIIILLLIIVNGNLSIDYERNCWSIVWDGTMVGTVINLVRGPRQGVRWSAGNKFLIYVHLFGQSQSTKKMRALYMLKKFQERFESFLNFGFYFFG